MSKAQDKAFLKMLSMFQKWNKVLNDTASSHSQKALALLNIGKIKTSVGRVFRADAPLDDAVAFAKENGYSAKVTAQFMESMFTPPGKPIAPAAMLDPGDMEWGPKSSPSFLFDKREPHDDFIALDSDNKLFRTVPKNKWNDSPQPGSPASLIPGLPKRLVYDTIHGDKEYIQALGEWADSLALVPSQVNERLLTDVLIDPKDEDRQAAEQKKKFDSWYADYAKLHNLNPDYRSSDQTKDWKKVFDAQIIPAGNEPAIPPSRIPAEFDIEDWQKGAPLAGPTPITDKYKRTWAQMDSELEAGKWNPNKESEVYSNRMKELISDTHKKNKVAFETYENYSSWKPYAWGPSLLQAMVAVGQGYPEAVIGEMVKTAEMVGLAQPMWDDPAHKNFRYYNLQFFRDFATYAHSMWITVKDDPSLLASSATPIKARELLERTQEVYQAEVESGYQWANNNPQAVRDIISAPLDLGLYSGYISNAAKGAYIAHEAKKLTPVFAELRKATNVGEALAATVNTTGFDTIHPQWLIGVQQQMVMGRTDEELARMWAGFGLRDASGMASTILDRPHYAGLQSDSGVAHLIGQVNSWLKKPGMYGSQRINTFSKEVPFVIRQITKEQEIARDTIATHLKLSKDEVSTLQDLWLRVPRHQAAPVQSGMANLNTLEYVGIIPPVSPKMKEAFKYSIEVMAEGHSPAAAGMYVGWDPTYGASKGFVERQKRGLEQITLPDLFEKGAPWRERGRHRAKVETSEQLIDFLTYVATRERTKATIDIARLEAMQNYVAPLEALEQYIIADQLTASGSAATQLVAGAPGVVAKVGPKYTAEQAKAILEQVKMDRAAIAEAYKDLATLGSAADWKKGLSSRSPIAKALFTANGYFLGTMRTLHLRLVPSWYEKNVVNSLIYRPMAIGQTPRADALLSFAMGPRPEKLPNWVPWPDEFHPRDIFGQVVDIHPDKTSYQLLSGPKLEGPLNEFFGKMDDFVYRAEDAGWGMIWQTEYDTLMKKLMSSGMDRHAAHAMAMPLAKDKARATAIMYGTPSKAEQAAQEAYYYSYFTLRDRALSVRMAVNYPGRTYTGLRLYNEFVKNTSNQDGYVKLPEVEMDFGDYGKVSTKDIRVPIANVLQFPLDFANIAMHTSDYLAPDRNTDFTPWQSAHAILGNEHPLLQLAGQKLGIAPSRTQPFASAERIVNTVAKELSGKDVMPTDYFWQAFENVSLGTERNLFEQKNIAKIISAGRRKNIDISPEAAEQLVRQAGRTQYLGSYLFGLAAHTKSDWLDEFDSEITRANNFIKAGATPESMRARRLIRAAAAPDIEPFLIQAPDERLLINRNRQTVDAQLDKMTDAAVHGEKVEPSEAEDLKKERIEQLKEYLKNSPVPYLLKMITAPFTEPSEAADIARRKQQAPDIKSLADYEADPGDSMGMKDGIPVILPPKHLLDIPGMDAKYARVQQLLMREFEPLKQKQSAAALASVFNEPDNAFLLRLPWDKSSGDVRSYISLVKWHNSNEAIKRWEALPVEQRELTPRPIQEGQNLVGTPAVNAYRNMMRPLITEWIEDAGPGGFSGRFRASPETVRAAALRGEIKLPVGVYGFSVNDIDESLMDWYRTSNPNVPQNALNNWGSEQRAKYPEFATTISELSDAGKLPGAAGAEDAIARAVNMVNAGKMPVQTWEFLSASNPGLMKHLMFNSYHDDVQKMLNDGIGVFTTDRNGNNRLTALNFDAIWRYKNSEAHRPILSLIRGGMVGGTVQRMMRDSAELWLFTQTGQQPSESEIAAFLDVAAPLEDEYLTATLSSPFMTRIGLEPLPITDSFRRSFPDAANRLDLAAADIAERQQGGFTPLQASTRSIFPQEVLGEQAFDPPFKTGRTDLLSPGGISTDSVGLPIAPLLPLSSSEIAKVQRDYISSPNSGSIRKPTGRYPNVIDYIKDVSATASYRQENPSIVNGEALPSTWFGVAKEKMFHDVFTGRYDAQGNAIYRKEMSVDPVQAGQAITTLANVAGNLGAFEPGSDAASSVNGFSAGLATFASLMYFAPASGPAIPIYTAAAAVTAVAVGVFTGLRGGGGSRQGNEEAARINRERLELQRQEFIERQRQNEIRELRQREQDLVEGAKGSGFQPSQQTRDRMLQYQRKPTYASRIGLVDELERDLATALKPRW